MFKLFIIYLVSVNIITVVLFALDKHRAMSSKKRIRERTLIFFSFVGGAFLALLSMYMFKHKTLKTKFIILIPLSFLLWSLIVMYLFNEGIII